MYILRINGIRTLSIEEIMSNIPIINFKNNYTIEECIDFIQQYGYIIYEYYNLPKIDLSDRIKLYFRLRDIDIQINQRASSSILLNNRGIIYSVCNGTLNINEYKKIEAEIYRQERVSEVTNNIIVFNDINKAKEIVNMFNKYNKTKAEIKEIRKEGLIDVV